MRRVSAQVAGSGLLLGLAVALAVIAPFLLVGAALYGVARMRGWGPYRAWRVVAAAWALPVGLWLVTGYGPAQAVAALGAPLAGHRWSVLPLPLAPWAAAVGVTVGAGLWWRTWTQRTNGLAARPLEVARFPRRQFERAMKRTAGEARRPGLAPARVRSGLVLGRAAMVTDGNARTRPEDPRWLTVDPGAARKHMVIVGAPGTGKTEAVLRLFYVQGGDDWRRYALRSGDSRPLHIFIDAKGGEESAKTGKRFAEICDLLGLAPGAVGIWPQRVRLDLWSLPPDRLEEVLVQLRGPATNEFFMSVRQELVHLVVQAPGFEPPRSSVEFVERLSLPWLEQAYRADEGVTAYIKSKMGEHLAGVAGGYRALFRSIGATLDCGRDLGDFDALYCTVEGTQNRETASAQAQALVELVTDLATRKGGERRLVTLYVDEFSAVSERVDLQGLLDRGRSLDLSVVVIAQSWFGLGKDEAAARQLLASAAGGLLVLSTAEPEVLAKLVGTFQTTETGMKLDELHAYTGEGTGRGQATYLLNPDWIRAMGKRPGQIVYAVHGRATWGVVSAPSLLRTPAAREVRAIRACWRTPIGPRALLAELEAGEEHDAASEGREGVEGLSPVPLPGLDQLVRQRRPQAAVRPSDGRGPGGEGR